jgi:signal transduction histidine kinase
MVSNTVTAQHHEVSAVARVLIKCNRVAARAADEREALQSVCDLLVEQGLFSGASIGSNRAGTHQGSMSAHCFLLDADRQSLGTLTLSATDPDAFTPEIVEIVADWCDGFAQLLLAARHGDGEVEQLRRTEAALRRSEAFLAKAQRVSRTGSFSWTASTGAMVWSNETFHILGYDGGRMTPTVADLLLRVAPEDQPRAEEIFGRAARDGEDFDLELRLRTPDGVRSHIRIVAQLLGSPATDEFVGAIMDVSELKEMGEAVTSREQVLGILGHDLRNPIGAVLGLVTMAYLKDPISPSLQEKLTRIERAAQRMNEMVDSLLDFTRTQFCGPLPIRPTETDLHDVCRRVVDELKAGHPHRAIYLLADGDTRGYWDAGRMAQVVSNLAANALTHGDPTAPVRVIVERSGEAATIKVHNFGRAIEREEIPLLFEPFHRAEHYQQLASRRGLGLGLHIVKQIVTAHGGSISVESSANDGTTFSIVLPGVAARSWEDLEHTA